MSNKQLSYNFKNVKMISIINVFCNYVLGLVNSYLFVKLSTLITNMDLIQIK